MLRWTLKSLIADPVQLLTGAGGVALALALVLFFEAVFAGESDQIVAYPEGTAPDLWVMQKGVANMHMAMSLVKDWKVDAVAAVEGVRRATPILYLNTLLEAGGRRWYAFIVGLPEDGARAGPWAMAEGKPTPDSGEVVIPELIARMSAIGLGDPVTIADRRFKVVGLSQGTYSMANSVAFVAERDLADLISATDLVSYLLVDVAPGASAAAVAARIRGQVESVNAVVAEDFVANDYQMAMQMGLEMISLMTFIAGALAVAVVGFSVYSQARRRRVEIAIARAIGVRPGALLVVATVQAMAVSALGVALAMAIAWLVMPLIAALVPQLTLHVTAAAIIRIAVVAMIATVIAALASVRRLLKVDPVTALQG